jgi:hypothetical protein
VLGRYLQKSMRFIFNTTSLYQGMDQTMIMFLHYEKLHPPKPHCIATKTQKSIRIQILCNYLLGITTTMQISPYKYGVLINKLSC